MLVRDLEPDSQVCHVTARQRTAINKCSFVNTRGRAYCDITGVSKPASTTRARHVPLWAEEWHSAKAAHTGTHTPTAAHTHHRGKNGIDFARGFDLLLFLRSCKFRQSMRSTPNRICKVHRILFSHCSKAETIMLDYDISNVSFLRVSATFDFTI